MRDPRYARRRRAALPAALAAFVALMVVSGARTPLTWAGGSPFTPAMTIVLPPQQVAVAPVDVVPDEPPGEPLPLDDGVPAAPPPAPADDDAGGGDDTAGGGGDEGDRPSKPAIRHVFVVMLSQTDLVALADPGDAAVASAAARRSVADATLDAVASPAPFLATRLVRQGTLLTRYASVARGSLANGVALLSGQGPTAQTLADCPTAAGAAPADVTPDVLGDDGQQITADGCVYPFATGTVADQLTAAGLDWRAYVEDAPGACPATPRDPFASFHSLLDTGACTRHVAGLDALDADLERSRDAPALSYVVPSACHDGRLAPCAEGAPAGPAAADAFLEDLVPRILASAAFADGGLLVITSDGPPPPPPQLTPPAPTTPVPPPPTPTEPTPPPTTPTTPVPPPGQTTPTPPPGQTTPTTPTPGPPSTDQTTATTAPQASGPSAPTASTFGPQATAAADPADAPFPTTYPNVGDAATAGAARVGALLISPSVSAGERSDVPANHFTLLRTISDLFALQPLGYAGATALKPLPERVLPLNEH